VFAKIHPSRRSPFVGLGFSFIVVSGLLIVGTLLNKAGADIDVVERLATVTVVFLLFIYALVIIACLKLRGHDEDEETYRANTALLVLGLIGNVVLLGYVVYDDPTSLYWVVALLAVGLVLFLVETVVSARKSTSKQEG
jgi:amino acid transporter